MSGIRVRMGDLVLHARQEHTNLHLEVQPARTVLLEARRRARRAPRWLLARVMRVILVRMVLPARNVVLDRTRHRQDLQGARLVRQTQILQCNPLHRPVVPATRGTRARMAACARPVCRASTMRYPDRLCARTAGRGRTLWHPGPPQSQRAARVRQTPTRLREAALWRAAPATPALQGRTEARV